MGGSDGVQPSGAAQPQRGFVTTGPRSGLCSHLKDYLDGLFVASPPQIAKGNPSHPSIRGTRGDHRSLPTEKQTQPPVSPQKIRPSLRTTHHPNGHPPATTTRQTTQTRVNGVKCHPAREKTPIRYSLSPSVCYQIRLTQAVCAKTLISQAIRYRTYIPKKRIHQTGCLPTLPCGDSI